MINVLYKSIGERVKHYRIERGYSQDQLAEGICSRQTISLLENGQHFPSAEFMKKIAIKLSVPLHEIMVDEVESLDVKTQIDILQVYIEMNHYNQALTHIEEIENQNLFEYQRRELVICRAECLIRTGRSQQALELLYEMQGRLEMNRDTDDHYLARLYDKLGTAEYFVSNIANAHAHYLRAFQIAQRLPTQDINAARIAFNLGMACRQLNRLSEAIQYLSVAERFFKDMSDEKRVAQTLFEIGIVFRTCKDYERADEYLQQALALYRSQNLLDLARIVRESYAYTVLSLKQPDVAIEELRHCIEEFEREGDVPNLAYTCARTSKLILEQNEVEEAGTYIQKALHLFTDEETKHQFKFVTVYQIYAEYLFAVQEFEACIHYSFLAAEHFKNMGYKKDAAKSLQPAIEAHRAIGNFEQALELSQQVIRLLSISQNLDVSGGYLQ